MMLIQMILRSEEVATVELEALLLMRPVCGQEIDSLFNRLLLLECSTKILALDSVVAKVDVANCRLL